MKVLHQPLLLKIMVCRKMKVLHFPSNIDNCDFHNNEDIIMLNHNTNMCKITRGGTHLKNSAICQQSLKL
jgi:hypothetical protein